jgi:hypothetical protein
MKKTQLVLIICFAQIITSFAQHPIEIIYDTLNSGIIEATEVVNGSVINEYTIQSELASSHRFNNPTDGEFEEPASLSNDNFLLNLYSPADLGGILPIDVTYNTLDGKLYYYGGKYIVVVDAITNTKLKKIEVSNTFNNSYSYVAPNCITKHIVYDPIQHTVYCSTFENKVIIIDCETDEILNTVELQLNNHYTSSLDLGLDNSSIFWFVNYGGSTGMNSFLTKINRQTHMIEAQRHFDAGIYDMACNYSNSIIYLSMNNNTGQTYRMYAVATNNFQIIEHFGEVNSGKLIISLNDGVIYSHKRGTSKVFTHNLTTYNQLNEIDISFNRIFSTEYNSVQNLIYFVGDYNSIVSGLSIVEPGSALEVHLHQKNGARSLVYSPEEDLVYFGSYNQLTAVDGRLYDQEVFTTLNQGCYSHKLALGFDNSIVSSNLIDGNSTIFDVGLNYLANINLGANLELGCINPNNEKIYYIHTYSGNANAANNHSYLTIFDANTLDIIIELDLGTKLTDIAYNPQNNRVYVTKLSERKVIPIDGNTDQIMVNDIITLPGTYSPTKMFISSNNKLFISTKSNIFIYDGNNHSLLNTINIQDRITSFVENSNDNLVYAAEDVNPIIRVISTETNTNIHNIALQSGYGAEKLAFDPVNKLLYSAHPHVFAREVNIIYNNQVIKTFSEISAPGHFAYNKLEDKMYLSTGAGTLVIQENMIIKTIPTGLSYGLVYNDLNNMIYSHHLNGRHRVMVIDCTTDLIVNDISLNQFQNGALLDRFSNGMVYDQNNNRIFCGNRGFSNISVIQCGTDILPLRKGWTWLSFPRLYRAKNNYVETIPVLERIGCFPVDLNMHYLYPWQQWIEYIDNTWDGPLTEIRSSDGYKLEIIPGSDEGLYVEMVGAKLHPNTGMTLLPNQENWIGYFLSNGQYPEDAFPSNLYNNRLTEIKTQDWTMVKILGEWFATSKIRPFNYGDMIILTINGTTPVDFQWNNTGIDEESEGYPETEYYEFDEQADYLPVFVETEPESDIEEIAILADNEVKGAVVRLPGDTLVQINAYIMDVPPGTPLEFETWSGLKSQRTGKGGYSVLNHQTRRYEHRTIYSGENKSFQFVSLKPKAETDVLPLIPALTCSPNPFSDKTVFSFTLVEEANLQLTIYDQIGKVVAIPVSGTFAPGNYSFAWNGQDLHAKQSGNGVYIYRFNNSSGQEFSGKIVLIK